MNMSTDSSKDVALRQIEAAVIDYFGSAIYQRDALARIVMALEGAGYMSARARPKRRLDERDSVA